MYLENLDSENFQFQSYSLKYRDPFKSYTLEKGDVDQDGDMDIIVGLFSYTITKAPQHLKELWQMADYDITILLNKFE